jgi:VWFA-related protein
MRSWPHLGVLVGSQEKRGVLRNVPSTILLAAFLATIAAIGMAQQPKLKTRSKEQRDREYLESHRVTMNVQVNDGDGRPVPNLAAEDFVLFDDHHTREIAALHEINGQAMYDATEIVIVLDAVNSTAQELEGERNGIFKYLAQSKGPLPYPTSFILWFDGHLKASSATRDRNFVGRAFVKMTKDVHSNACAPVEGSVAQAVEGGGAVALGQSGIGGRAEDVAKCHKVHFRDSIAALDGIANQQRSIGGRTILIWAGPGWPLPSDVEFQRLSTKARQTFFEETVDLVRDLREAQVTIDEISPPDGAREAEMARVDMPALSAGTTSAREAGPADVALSVLARQTGGRVLNKSDDVTADLASCIHDADVYYSVTFEMMHAAAPHEFHPVELKVNRPGLQVRTMTEYYAEP